MFKTNETVLKEQGASITTREIKQQPELWQEVGQIYQDHHEEIQSFLKQFVEKAEGKVRVIFTGAGTSAYVGDTVTPYLTKVGDHNHFYFESIATTDIVAAPEEYLQKDVPTILVSFARSGNSPESVAAVKIAKKFVNKLAQLTITCAPKGHLAQAAREDPSNLVLLMPALANDQGFAMTGSFSCMTLMTLLVFDQTELETKLDYLGDIIVEGHEVIDREDEIKSWLTGDFDRVIYLGSGCLSGLTREAQLKILELTAGKVATMFDSSMGFRHGPKSFINSKTLVFDFMSSDAYTRQYDLDILNEINQDDIAQKVVGISIVQPTKFSGTQFLFTSSQRIPDGYQALPDVLVAQTIALNCSVKVGNLPDTPSPTGTVNRVVKGVTIHDYE